MHRPLNAWIAVLLIFGASALRGEKVTLKNGKVLACWPHLLGDTAALLKRQKKEFESEADVALLPDVNPFDQDGVGSRVVFRYSLRF